jgi:DNA mismatch repair protein MutS2
VGTVVEIRGQRVTLEAGGRRILASAVELRALEGGSLAEAEPRPAEGGVRTPVLEPDAVSRVDVRGRDLEDAWTALDRALDRCILAGTHRLELIHGKGTGTLRRGLHERLQQDPRVREHRLAEAPHGDDGLTLVELR